MKDIKVLYAEVIFEERAYIYIADGRSTNAHIGKAYCNRPDLSVQIIALLDASRLYPVEATEEELTE